MKTKTYRLLFLFVLSLLAFNAKSQCGVAGRYVDTIFTTISLDSVTYSDTFGLKMDILQPVGDTASLRPLIVLAHGGSFVSGTREDDNTVTTLCTDLASKGYVTASIDYRLASEFDMLDSISAITEVLKSISDFKAAVRYFYKDAATTNIYKIDTNRIFIGGNSAGAVAADHYGYIDSLAMVPVYMQNIFIAGGGLQGNSGNPGYSNKVRGIINLAGGLGNPAWIAACSLPIVSAQGSADDIVPYTCADAEDGYVPVKLCGLGSMQPYITANTPYYRSIVFPGQGHIPWATNPAMMYQVDTIVTQFLNYSQCANVPVTCLGFTGSNDIKTQVGVSLFPNPATDVVNIQSSEIITAISIFDVTGRLVFQTNGINEMNYQFNINGLSKGVYFIKISSGEDELPVVRKVIVE